MCFMPAIMMSQCDNRKPDQCVIFSINFCLVFLLTMAIHPTCSDKMTEVPADSSTLKVSELPFSQKLVNPCSLTDPSRLQNAIFTRRQKIDVQRMVVDEIMAATLQLKDDAESILRTKVLRNCASFDLEAVAFIPSNEDISKRRPLDVLRLFYTSLLNHTARMHFMSEQLQRYFEDNCSGPELYKSSNSLAVHMRELMCVLRITILTLEQPDDRDSFDEPTKQILNDLFVDQPICSRRAIRDCQTVSSTVALLQQLSIYLHKTVLIEDGNESSAESCGLLQLITFMLTQ